ncbi:MAG: RagB/SusD family nutrient uptake outer membrane protein [Deltaproteobacteria bacterium]
MKNIQLNKIKKLLILPALVLSMLYLDSCKEIIELDPYNQVSETTAFTTPSLVELSVVGMYNAAQRGDYAGNFRGYPFGAAFVQQGDCRAEDAVNQQAFYRFTYEGTYDATTANNQYYWQDTYRAINRCNIIIDGVKTAATNGVITESAAKAYEGEAKLLRAALYHELLLHFARPYKHTADASHVGVPYHDKPYTTIASINEGMLKGRETVAFVYGKILEDLDYAEANLPLRAGWTGTYKMTRGTKGAAAAYKLRIYQHMYKWDEAAKEGDKFYTGGPYAAEYALGANPWTMWNDYNSNEYVFGMENSATNNPGVNAALASQYKRRLLVCVSPIIWRNASWLPDDKRRKDPEMVFKSNGQVYTSKYKDDVNYTDPSPMMRFPEVLLNHAEALARRNASGDVTKALELLNKVRNRALADPATQAYTAASFADNVALLKAILVERRIEFAMEGRRWPDVHRLQFCPYFPIKGIPAKIANLNPVPAAWFTNAGEFGTQTDEKFGIANVPYDNFKFVWPIPLTEINANPTLAKQQNPGY